MPKDVQGNGRTSTRRSSFGPVATGQSPAFEVVAGGGVSTITYHWRKDNVPIVNATNPVYALAAVQKTNAGFYGVVVANAVNSRTSAVAILTVRDPLSLAWTGQNGNTWDLSAVSWLDTISLANVPYSGGDHVRFDDRGVSSPTINLAGLLNPSPRHGAVCSMGAAISGSPTRSFRASRGLLTAASTLTLKI